MESDEGKAIPLPGQVHGFAQMPADARRVGLDTTTSEGQMVYLASAFSSKKRSHKIIVWCVLVLLVGLPILLAIMNSRSGN